jgi:catechol 2,3-dioxygenase-like lactoylglutathione lyase family enzyme
MTVTRIQNCYYATRDADASRAFYENLLGLTVAFADEGRWVQFKVGGSNFALAGPGEAPEGMSGGMVVFEVGDLAPFRVRLVESGARIVGERDMGDHGAVLTVEDPDGNLLQLFARPKSA